MTRGRATITLEILEMTRTACIAALVATLVAGGCVFDFDVPWPDTLVDAAEPDLDAGVFDGPVPDAPAPDAPAPDAPTPDLTPDAGVDPTLWVVHGGSSLAELPYRVVTDAKGAIYLAGVFRGKTGTLGGKTLVSQGAGDLFVAKLGATGAVAWVTTAGGAGNDLAYDLALDTSGNLYVVGYFEGTADFGGKSVTTKGGRDLYVAKLDPTGKFLWVTHGGGAAKDHAKGVTLGSNGAPYITGWYTGKPTLEGTGNSDAPKTLPLATLSDIFVAKLDPTDGSIFPVAFGGSDVDEAEDIAAISTGAIFVAGSSSSKDLKVGTSTSGSKGGRDVILIRLNSALSPSWVKRFGGTGDEESRGLAVDANDHLYLTGYFKSSPAAFGSKSVYVTDGAELFVAKLDGSGVAWVGTAAGSGPQEGIDVTVTPGGDVVVAGYSGGALTFAKQKVPAASNEDIFVGAFDGNGNQRWALAAGGKDADRAWGVAPAGAGKLVVVGNFQDKAAFPLPGSSHQRTSAGYTDLFIWKLMPP